MWQFLIKNEDEALAIDPSKSSSSPPLEVTEPAPSLAPALQCSAATTATNKESVSSSKPDDANDLDTKDEETQEKSSNKISPPSLQSLNFLNDSISPGKAYDSDEELPSPDISSSNDYTFGNNDSDNSLNNNAGDETSSSLGAEESDVFRVIDSDDLIGRLITTRFKSKVADDLVKDKNIDILLNYMLNSHEAFLRRYQEKNMLYYGEDYDPEAEGEKQYEYQEFDELDYYFDNIMCERDGKDIEDQELKKEDFDLRKIKEKVKESLLIDKKVRNKNSGTNLNEIIDLLDKGISDIQLRNDNDNKYQTKEENVEDESNKKTKSTERSYDSLFSKDDEKIINRSCIIAEIYSSDIDLIVEAFMGNPDHLKTLWKMLEKPQLFKVIPYVQLFAKINETMLVRKTDQFLNFVRANIDLVDLFVKKNVDISLLNEFLFKLIITDRVFKPTGIIDLLDEQNLIHHVMNLIDEKYPPFIREFAGDFIKNLIGFSTYASENEGEQSYIIGPNNLTRSLVTFKSVWKMANRIKQGDKTLFIIVDIIIELIRKNNDDYDRFHILSFSKYKSYLLELDRDTNITENHEQGMENQETVPSNFNKDTIGEESKLNDRASFEKLYETFPPSDHDPIYLNNILKVFSFDIEWVHHCLEKHLGKVEDEYFFDENTIDHYFFDKNPASELTDEKEVEFVENKIYIKQSFGYIEKLTFDKLKLVELVAELLHCSNIKLYNNRNAEWLIEHRNKSIRSKEKYLKEALEDTLLIDSDNVNSSEVEIPFTDKRSVNDESFISENDQVDDDDDEYEGDDDDVDDDDSFERFQYENGSKSDFSIIGPNEEEQIPSLLQDKKKMGTLPFRTEELSNAEWKAKKENVVSKLALKIDKSMSTKIPASEVIDEQREFNEDSNNNNLFTVSEEEIDYENIGLINDNKHPFVCEENENKLRENQSLGDFFKIKLHDIGILDLIFKKIFLRYPWNNLLHNVVFDLIQQLLGGKIDNTYNGFLISDLFFRSKIIDLILISDKRSQNFQKKYNISLGYMGHISLISEEINKFMMEINLSMLNPKLMELSCRNDWFEYINDKLNETKRNYGMVLGGTNNNNANNNNGKLSIKQNYHINANSILLGSTEEEIQNQDVNLSNPESLKNREKYENGDENGEFPQGLIIDEEEDGDNQEIQVVHNDSAFDDEDDESFPVKFDRKIITSQPNSDDDEDNNNNNTNSIDYDDE